MQPSHLPDADSAAFARPIMLDRARELSRTGAPEALETWLRFERHHPQAGEARKPLATLLLAAGRPEEALERIERLEEHDARAAAKLRVRALHGLGRHEEMCRQVDALGVHLDVPLVALAVRAHRERGEEDAAFQRLAEARRRWPEHPRLIEMTLAAKALRDDPAAALELIETLPPELADTMDVAWHRARALFETGNSEAAARICDRALEGAPDNRKLLLLSARVAQATLQAGTASDTEANARWEALLAQSPQHQEALRTLALNAIERGSRDAAASAIERFGALRGNGVPYKRIRLQTRFAERFGEEAATARAWRETLDDPDTSPDEIVQVATALARLESRRGQPVHTLAALDRLHAVGGTDADARLLWAQTLFGMGRYDEGCDRLGDPDSMGSRAEAALELAFDARMRSGSSDRARALCETATARSSFLRPLMLGRLEFVERRYAIALEHFRQAVAEEPADRIDARTWVVRTLETTEGPKRAAAEVRAYMADATVPPALEARLWSAAGSLDAAEGALARAARDTGSTSSWVSLARSQWQRGHWDDAWRSLRDAVRAGHFDTRLESLRAKIEKGFRVVGVPVPSDDLEARELSFRSSERMVGELVDRSLAAPVAPQPSSGPGKTIVLVISSLSPGGAERQAVNLANGLAAHDPRDRVYLLCTHMGRCELDRFYADQLDPRVELVQYYRPDARVDPASVASTAPHADLLEHMQPISRSQAIVQLAATLERLRPDAVHGWLDETFVNVTLAGSLVGVPRIVGRWGNMPPGVGHTLSDAGRAKVRYLEQAHREIARLPGLVLSSNSRRASDAYARLMGLDCEEVGVVYNGIDAERLLGRESEADSLRASLGIPRDALVLGSVYRFTEQKRPTLWLDVAIRLARRDSRWRFVIVGEGAMRSVMERIIGESGLEDRFHLVGSQSDIGTWFSLFDMTLMTSSTEGVSNVVIESQLCGCPVVAPDVGGLPEAIAHGESGLVLDTANADDFVDAVESIALDPNRLARFSADAVRFADEKFSLGTMVRRYRALLVDKLPDTTRQTPASGER